jgi:hypothetical protein
MGKLAFKRNERARLANCERFVGGTQCPERSLSSDARPGAEARRRNVKLDKPGAARAVGSESYGDSGRGQSNSVDLSMVVLSRRQRDLQFSAAAGRSGEARMGGGGARA